MAQGGKGTYQMLWDCPFCGTQRLLGLDHRHCPACGAAQDESKRYFPSDDQKVAVVDHVYHGADRDCPACSTPNAAIAKFCVNCGSPLDEAGEVKRVVDPPREGAGDASQQRGKRRRRGATEAPKRGRGKLVAGCLVGLVALVTIAAILVAILWKKPVEIVATDHSWERAIQVEEYGPDEQDAWCDQMPAQAYRITRRQEVRDHRKVQDGQTCVTARRDNGDGTFTEYDDCKPKYRDEPIYADKCRFMIDRWKPSRKLSASGGRGDPPTWPELRLVRTGDCVGCERGGARSESYTVHFRDAEGSSFLCDMPEQRWGQVAVGSTWSGKAGVLTGKVDCSSLVAK